MKPGKNIITVLVAAVLAGALSFWIMSASRSDPSQQEAGQQKLEAPAEPGIEKKFETLLNDFLKDIKAQMRDYVRQRKVIVESVRPVNLRTPEYVEENYNMVITLIPTLRMKIDALMQSFSQAEEEIKTLLEGQPPQMQENIMRQWNELKDNEAVAYVEFFNIEGDILNAYEELMTFYYNKSGVFDVDMEADKILFKSSEDEAASKYLLQKIEVLTHTQQEVLQN